MEIDREIIRGLLVALIFVLWQIKMFNHFEYLKKARLIAGNNYLMFLLNPFKSGYYYMLIICPLVFNKHGGINIVIAKICVIIIWAIFIFIVSKEI
ncbi:MAG: hypothetical protein ACXIUD_08465 [Mongoliitalea sp.]